MFALRYKKVKSICDRVIRLNLRREFRMLAEARQKYRMDMEAIKDYAWDEGHADGYGAGHAAGHAVGYNAAKAEDVKIIEAHNAAMAKKDAEIAGLKAQLAKK